MNYYTIAGLILIGATIIFVLFANADESRETDGTTSIAPVQMVYLSTSTLPLAVSGVVEAADAATVYAQAAGVVQSLPYQVGSTVVTNTILAVQSGSVQDTRVSLAETQRKLAETERGVATEVSDANHYLMIQKSQTAEQLSDIRDGSSQNRTSEATKALNAGVTAATDSILSAVDFINNNRSLITADGRQSYDETLKLIYGQTPTYFTSIITARPKDSFQSLLQLNEESGTSAVAATQAGERVVAILQLLDEVFMTAERRVFDRRHDTPVSIKDTYLQQSEAIAGTLVSMERLLAESAQAVDALKDIYVVQKGTVMTSNIERDMTAIQAEYARELTDRTEAVQAAAVSVAAAERALGTITAPFAGMVTEVFINEGEYAAPGTPLLRLVGNGITEITVTVPRTVGQGLQPGQSFVVAEEVAGYVDRFAPQANGYGYLVVIILNSDMYSLGQTVRGHIEVETIDQVFSIPRTYVHFDSSGAFIQYQNKVTSRVQIVYDSGTELFLRVDNPQKAALQSVNQTQF